MSIVRMDIDILKQLSNNEAATYFSLISVMDNQGKCNLKLDDIAKVAGFSIATLIDHFAKFKDKGIIQIDKVTRWDNKGIQNAYSYKIPTKSYIEIDSKLMNEPITKNQLGLLVRLKAYTMVGTNIIPFSLNQIVHIVSANHDAIYASMKIGLLERYEKIGFRFLKEELFPIN